MIIIKIGGGADINLEGIYEDIGNIKEPMLILHGANALRDDLLLRLGKEKTVITSVSGVSSVASTQELIDVMMMSYAGLQNKRIVEGLQQAGVNALGLSGLDGGLIRGRRNRGIRIIEDGKKKIFRDFSGKANRINIDLLHLLLQEEFVPVITVPILDENGVAINSENDDILSLLSSLLQPRLVISLIGAPGIMADIDDDSSLIRTLSIEHVDELLRNLEGRIQRKLMALKSLRKSCDAEIVISDGRVSHPITNAISGSGTRIPLQ